MSTAGWIAVRYLRTRRRQFARLITWVSVLGLALGVLVLTVVISVMNGFDAELRSRILGTVPHLVIEGVTLADPVAAEALDHPRVTDGYDFFLGAGMVTRNGAVNPVTVYGITAEDRRALPEVAAHMVSGSIERLGVTPRGILLGAPLAAYLGLIPGDSVALVISEPSAGGVRPRINRFQLAGTFELGAELDYSLAVVDLDAFAGTDLSTIGVGGVRLTVDDPVRAPQVAAALEARYPDLRIRTWVDSFGELFRAVRLEKILMFLTLLMVVAVAAFNIVSGQMMVVNDKRADIAILRTMGATAALVRRVFLLQGVLISGLGIALGLGLGYVLALHISSVIAAVEGWLGFQLLAGTYFVEVPSVVKGVDLAVIAAVSGLLCVASAWLPAHRAALMNPVDGLHQG